jgi:hypothetical protein
MANWTTASGISRNYSVGVERLLEYSRRGNLPMRKEPDGTLLFDEEIVRCFFRLRSARAEAPVNNLGVLGQAHLSSVQNGMLPTRRSAPTQRSDSAQRSDSTQRSAPARRSAPVQRSRPVAVPRLPLTGTDDS